MEGRACECSLYQIEIRTVADLRTDQQLLKSMNCDVLKCKRWMNWQSTTLYVIAIYSKLLRQLSWSWDFDCMTVVQVQKRTLSDDHGEQEKEMQWSTASPLPTHEEPATTQHSVKVSATRTKNVSGTYSYSSIDRKISLLMSNLSTAGLLKTIEMRICDAA